MQVDGFRRCHGLHEQARCQFLWLDLVKFAENVRPHSSFEHVHHFTAPAVGDAGVVSRQSVYQRAFEGRSPDRLTIVQGRDQSKPKHCRACQTSWMERDEKETDVNIAFRLVADVVQAVVDTAMLISADSDLAPAVRMARELNPSPHIVAAFPPRRYSDELKNIMPGSLQTYVSRVKKSLLPETVVSLDATTLTRLQNWA